MPDYKETTVTGTQYVRCNTVTILNPLGGVRAANFSEETVINLGENRQIKEGSGGFQIPFVAENAMTEFDLLNPETGEPTGQKMKYIDMYVALYSLYITGALARDAAVAQAEADRIAAEQAALQATEGSDEGTPTNP